MKSENVTPITGGTESIWKQDYDKLIASGMAWEFHPWLTGNWEEDKTRYVKEIVKSTINENSKD